MAGSEEAMCTCLAEFLGWPKCLCNKGIARRFVEDLGSSAGVFLRQWSVPVALIPCPSMGRQQEMESQSIPVLSGIINALPAES